MANNGIKESWSFVEFSHKFAKVKYAHDLVNGESKEKFNAVVCIDEEGNNTFLSFSKKLGQLTPKELVEQKNDLQVVLNEGVKGQDVYTICKQGANAWVDLDI